MPRKKPGRQKPVAPKGVDKAFAGIGIRPQVVKFAIAMERVLERHDNKGTWSGISNERLYFLLMEEVAELAASIAYRHGVAAEAVDVANYAMMIYDNNK